MRIAQKWTYQVWLRVNLSVATVVAASLLRGGTVTAQSTASRAVTVSSTQDKVEDDDVCP